MLETDDVPILFSLPQMQNLGITFELDPKRAKITCSASGLYSSRVEYSTMEHIVLDLASLADQPKSRERSARHTKHEISALSQRKSAYLARAQELDDEEDDRLLVRPNRTSGSEEEDKGDRPLMISASKKKRRSVNLPQYAEFLHRHAEDKDLQSGEIHLPRWNKMRQEPRVSDQKMSRICANIRMVKLFRTISISCRIYAT